jgi:FMN phosphatase YigB (HAD superfamily)
MIRWKQHGQNHDQFSGGLGSTGTATNAIAHAALAPREVMKRKHLESAVQMICFDVGYTLIDETRSWLAWAARLEVTPDQLFETLRETIELGDPQPNRRALERLRPDLDFDTERTAIVGRAGASIFAVDDIYPEVRPTLDQLNRAGFRLGAAGNMRIDSENVLAQSGLPLEFVGSSERWGVAKPDLEFFDRIIAASGVLPERIVYVGDRVDNDVIPARKSGMKTVLIRRGLWATTGAENEHADAQIDLLTELPAVIELWRSSSR